VNPWLLTALAAGASSAVAAVYWLVDALGRRAPRDERRTDRPPALWRLGAPLTQPIAAQVAPWLSARTRFALFDRLRRGGLEFALSPEQFVAGRLVASLAAVAVVAAVFAPRGPAPAAVVLGAMLLGYVLPASWLRDRIESRRRAVLRELPFYLDVITLAVESGLNLGAALVQAVDKGPAGPLRAEFDRVLRDVRAGRSRAEALRGLAERLALPAIRSLVAALLVAEKQGSALGPVLRAQADQRRTERFLRAEKLAMEAPVKMLPPLLVFVFPCTFVILLFPVASRMLQEGWLR
jgi:tight adherence protein C